MSVERRRRAIDATRRRAPWWRASAAFASRIGVSLVGTVVLGACASPGLPPGGPVDKNPPVVVKVTPDSGATNVKAKEFSIRFDEVVSERPRGAADLAGAFVLSPSDGGTRVEWHRSEITIRPRKGFRPATAYSLTMLAGVGDLTGNLIKRDRTWVFSTGPSIPRGVVRGAVFDWSTLKPASGALIDARVGADTTFRWIAKADSSGRYTLPFLPYTTFLVRAIIDGNSNGRLDPLEVWDTVSVAVSDSVRADLYAFKHDTVGPRIVGVDVRDSVTVRLTFDRALAVEPALEASQIELRAADSTRIPLRSLQRAAVYDSLLRVRDAFKKDSAQRADTSAAGRAARARADSARLVAQRDSIERARVDARRAARDTVAKVPPPVPTRPMITADYVAVLERPITPGSYTLVARNALSISRRMRTSERTFTRNKPVEKKPDAKADAKSDGKPDAKSAAKQPDAKAPPKPETTPEAKPDAKQTPAPIKPPTP